MVDAFPRGEIGSPPSFGDRYWRADPLASTDGAALLADEPAYREVADNLPTLCWVADADGYITWYNRRWHEYCGTTPVEMEGWGWQAVHDPAVLPSVMERWQASIATGEAFEMVFPLRGADGVFRPFLTRILPVRDENGTVRRWIGNNIDVSAQVAAEQQLRRSQEELQRLHDRLAEREAFLSSVLASSTDCIKVLDIDGRLTFMSEGGQRVMEVSDFNTVKACPWPDFWAGIGHVEARAAVEAARRGEARSFIGQADTMRGTPKWWHVAVSPIAGPDGRPERILSVSRDITDLRESEQARDRFVRLAENSQDLIGMAHPDGRLFYLNDAGCRLAGVAAAAVPTLRLTDLFPADEVARFAEEILPGVDRDGHWAGELDLQHAGTGERLPVLFSAFPITDAGGAIVGYGTVTRDFREHKAAEERLHLLNGEIAHRLKNTLSVVQAIASQTLAGADPAAVAIFGERLVALSTAHEVLLRRRWSGANLGEVARTVLATFGRPDHVTVSGPDLSIGPRATLALSLLLHELATNAVKHGALSVHDGTVALDWTVAGTGDDATVTLRWVERGGPPAVAPTRRGFGSRIIRLGLSGSGGTELRYEPVGLTAEMTASLIQLQQA